MISVREGLITLRDSVAAHRRELIGTSLELHKCKKHEEADRLGDEAARLKKVLIHLDYAIDAEAAKNE